MDIVLRNIPGTTAQQAVVTVNRGGEDDVGPTISYLIEHDSITIEQETAEGRIVAHGVLSLSDIDVLSNNTPPAAAVHALANRITDGYPCPTQVLAGKIAADMLVSCLSSMCAESGTGRVHVLRDTHGAWEKLHPEAVNPDALRSAQIVILDGGSIERGCWKYTYFPQQETGVFLDERPRQHV